MRSDILLMAVVLLAVGTTASPIRSNTARVSSPEHAALLGRGEASRHRRAKGDYHSLPRHLSDEDVDGKWTSSTLARRAADDIDLTKVVDLNPNEGAAQHQQQQQGDGHEHPSSGTEEATLTPNHAIDSANKGHGGKTSTCSDDKGSGEPTRRQLEETQCGGSTSNIQSVQPGLQHTKSHDTLPSGGGDGNGDSSTPDSDSKEDKPEDKGTTSGGDDATDTAQNKTAPAPTTPATTTPTTTPLPTTTTTASPPQPMSLLISALVDIIKAFEKATTPANATTPTPIPTPTLTVTPTATPTSDPATDSSSTNKTDSSDESSDETSSSDRRSLRDEPFEWMVIRGGGEMTSAAEEFEAEKRRLLSTLSEALADK